MTIKACLVQACNCNCTKKEENYTSSMILYSIFQFGMVKLRLEKRGNRLSRGKVACLLVGSTRLSTIPFKGLWLYREKGSKDYHFEKSFCMKRFLDCVFRLRNILPTCTWTKLLKIFRNIF